MLKTPMRDRTKFASEFTEWVYDNCGSEFYFGDIDGAAYKRSNNMMRLYEWKHPGAKLSPGQRCYYTKMAESIRLAIEAGVLADGSGVFVVYGTPPFNTGASVYNFMDDRTVEFDRDELIEFIRCYEKFPPAKSP